MNISKRHIGNETYFITAVDKRPDFISLQMRSLQKFCIGDFHLVVLNNSQNKKRAKSIEVQCRQSGAKHIRVDFKDSVARSSHSESVFRFGRYRNPNLACSYPYHWFVKQHLSELAGANVVFIDSDMFLIKSVDFRALLSTKSLFFVPQFRGAVSQNQHEVLYPWNGLMIADTTDARLRLDQIEWSPKIQKGFATDVGGASTEWLEIATRDAPSSELLSFGILSVSSDLSQSKSQISLNGNWNALLENSSGSDNWRMISSDSLSLAARILNCTTPNVEAVLSRRLRMAIDKLRSESWPDPLWIDFLSAPEVGLDDFILHYKSGSNYLKWATPEYNFRKTHALTSCFTSLG